MSQARVESLEVLKSFKAALVKFIEAANVAIVDAEGDLNRTRMWIETEQSTHWQREIRRRQDILARAEEALRMKKIFKDVTGARQSYIDEEKAVQKARRAIEHAQQKAASTASWRRKMEKVAHDFKGSIQRLGTTVAADLPAAVARVENMLRKLEAYVAAGPVEVTSASGAPPSSADEMTGDEKSMARGKIDDSPENQSDAADGEAGRNDQPAHHPDHQ